nr:solute carrier family 23 protein [endosymbiont 'TC1' of Trimyema compressum]
MVATAVGMSDFSQLQSAEFFRFITPFAFGLPTFNIQGIISICIVMLVVMTESTGMFFTIGNIAQY